MKRIAVNGIGLMLLLALLGIAAAAQNQPASNSQSSSSDSLADYARQIRKDSATHAKPRSFDNDNLPKDDKLSIVGSEESAAAESSAETKPEESAAAAPAAEKPKNENHASPEGKPAPKAETKAEGQSETKTEAPSETKSEAPAQPKATEDKSAASSSKPPDDEAAAKQAEWKQWGEKITTQKEQIDLAERELNVLQREYQIRAAAMYGDAGNRLRNQADWDKQDAQYKQQIADKQKAVEDAKQKLDDLQEDARKAGVPASVRESD